MQEAGDHGGIALPPPSPDFSKDLYYKMQNDTYKGNGQSAPQQPAALPVWVLGFIFAKAADHNARPHPLKAADGNDLKFGNF